MIDEAGEDDAKSESDKAAGSEVCILIANHSRTLRGEQYYSQRDPFVDLLVLVQYHLCSYLVAKMKKKSLNQQLI